MAGKKSFMSEIKNPVEQFISAPEPLQRIQEISDPDSQKERPNTPPAGMKLNPAFIEKRTARVQLLVQPSLVEKVKAIAKQKKCSVNDFIHSLLEKAVEGNG